MRSPLRPFRRMPRPTGQDHARIRRMGLRRALAVLQEGERANERLYRWTQLPERVNPRPLRGIA
ncbi:MAG TPA: hypothetical protein VHQ42_06960 [Candidatus Limnocylindria bacterium]|nr:hypothetical protein [Candidatus Limnocylindria bacterium]